MGDDEIYRFALDCKDQFVACGDDFVTTTNSISNKAAATRAGYGSWKAARMATTFVITYPETLVKKSGAKDAAYHGGYTFTPDFGSDMAFKGTIEHSTKDAMTNQLSNNMDIH